MKFLPHTRAGKIRSVFLFAVLAGILWWLRLDRVAAYAIADKQEGDILFQSLPHADLVDAIEGVTRSEWSHCGILVRRDGRWVVAEALGEVRYTPLYSWVVRGRRSRIEAWRVDALPSGAAEKIRSGVDQLLGRSYDFRYAPDDSEIYCSELVCKVYDRALGVSVGSWQKLGDLNWQPFHAFINSMEPGRPPLEREMVTPVSFTRSRNVRRVFPR